MPELPRIPRRSDDDHSTEAVEARRALLREVTGVDLPHLSGQTVPLEQARGKIENLIGHAQIPLGIAGPQTVDTSAGLCSVYVPMATTEGAMIASYSRGMRLCAAGGGARARVVREGLTQNPILVYRDARSALAAREVTRASFERASTLVETTTKHGKLIALEAEVVGRRLLLRLVFTTGDAIGINMAARAAELVSELISRETEAEARYVHGQDVEKRANARAMIEGRGRSVLAEVRIPRAALATLARVTPEALADIQRSYATGFSLLGTQNWTVQSANGLAGIFAATGQDVAYVTECATGLLDLEVDSEGDLFACVTLPSLLVGTVGGGSSQGTAAECLALMDCLGAGKANHFAELIGAAVLAGDLSLMAAFCSHEFVDAHERLGRNRPDATPGARA